MSKRLLVALATVATLSGTLQSQLAPTSVEMVSRRRDPCAKAPPAPTWRFTIAPYGWFAGINGTTGVRDFETDVDVSFSDIFSHLRWATMGTFEVGYGHWVGILDGVYSSIRVDRTRSIDPFQRELDFTSKMLITQGFIGYAFVPARSAAIDVLGGARLWSVKSTLKLSSSIVNNRRSRSPVWADAIGGLRVRWAPADRWHLSAEGDAGGGGSKGTGEAMGTVGYDLSRHWALFASYRYLHENVRKREYFFDGHLGGPVIGGAYRW